MVGIDEPRDNGSTFGPQIVKKRQRPLTGIDETGEIAAHFTGVFGASVSKDTFSRITEKSLAR